MGWLVVETTLSLECKKQSQIGGGTCGIVGLLCAFSFKMFLSFKMEDIRKMYVLYGEDSIGWEW